MKQHLRWDGKTYEFELQRAGDSLGISSEGAETQAELRWRDGSQVAIEVDGVLRRFDYIRRGSELLLTDGHGYWRLSPGAAQAAEEHAASDGRVLSHMPGTVLQVIAAVGASVQRGAPLLILEAMKMEHVIAAPLDGAVTSLPVATGQRVMPGDLLAQIEPAQ